MKGILHTSDKNSSHFGCKFNSFAGSLQQRPQTNMPGVALDTIRQCIDLSEGWIDGWMEGRKDEKEMLKWIDRVPKSKWGDVVPVLLLDC